MNPSYRIALDAMGGDHGLSVIIPAAQQALQQWPDIELILVGDEQGIREVLKNNSDYDASRLHVQHASQVVDMDESPALALRQKKDSSMRVAINLVKKNEADAVVSAGNTGALMATARFVLKMLPGVDRPAICTQIPSINGHTHMLDLGANIDCTAEHLYQFAVMGSVLVQAIDDIQAPKVGLLNIGQEAIKGSVQIKEAGALLEKTDLNYIGFVEGDDIYIGDVDVVACDGFVGNVALKTSEGLAKMTSQELKAHFLRNMWTKLAGLMAYPVLKAFRKRYDPRRYNGASLLGLQGIAIKSHGGADALAFQHAIGIARTEVMKNVPERIGKELTKLLKKGQGA